MGRKRDIWVIDDFCRRHRITGDEEFEFRIYIHSCKDSGIKGSLPKGDYNESELRERLDEFRGNGGSDDGND